MEIPPGHTEASVLEAIEKVVNQASDKFVFGYLEAEDVRQETRVFCLELLAKGKYDPSRPLEKYLYTHAVRRLINFKRDNYRRTDPPCNLCHQGRESEHADRKVCRKYLAWKKRNATKANLTRPLSLDGIADDRESGLKADDRAAELASFDELRSRIDRELDPTLRSDYLRMLAGERLPTSRRKKVEAAVRVIACPSNPPKADA